MVKGDIMEKVIRDGKVAVLIAPGYVAGWYTWNDEHPELLFHPKLVEMVESGRRSEITEDWLMTNLDIDIYPGGRHDLKIVWLDVGTAFRVEEYDGWESITVNKDLYLIA